MELTHARLLEVLNYNPDTGLFVWKIRRHGKTTRAPATRVDNYGYHNLFIDGRSYKAHRVAWFYVNGAWPSDQIDHANGKRDDNRIANLREASYTENGQNRALQKNSKTGMQGVCWDSAKMKYRAQIAKDGKRYTLGRFDTAEAAQAAYLAAKATLHTFQPTLRSMGKRMGRAGKTA